MRSGSSTTINVQPDDDNYNMMSVAEFISHVSYRRGEYERG